MRALNVLVACEFSGIVRDAFARRDWYAWSCDLLPSEKPGAHFCGDVFRFLENSRWDLIIAHPPCTYLARSGARWWKDRQQEQRDAIDFVLRIAGANCDYIAIENPIGKLSTAWRKPDQIIQPWQFGHGETKATCLWLKGLPQLRATNIVDGRDSKIHKMPPGPNRWKNRSRTYTGIADAMANQWGAYLEAGYARSNP